MKEKTFLLCLIPIIILICGSAVAMGIAYLDYEYNLNTNNKVTHKYDIYEINISSRCIVNNSVGNDWSVEYYLNGERIGTHKEITIPIHTKPIMQLQAVFTEDDKYSDISASDTQIILFGDSSHKFYISVAENNGHFKGNIAEFEIIVHIKNTGQF